MEHICTGCLCSDRKMYRIGDTGFSELYSQILNEIPVQNTSEIFIRICWECCALLQKFQQFKAQVKRNYMQLLWSNPTYSSPARLSTKSIYNISYPELDQTDSINNDNVKNEKTEIEDEAHIEPETFVRNLAVVQNVTMSTSPARLSTTSIYNISYPELDITDSINNDNDNVKNETLLVNIKTEIEEEAHMEPESFVHNLAVVQNTERSTKKTKIKNTARRKGKVKKRRIEKETPKEIDHSDGVSDTELSVLLEDDFKNIKDSEKEKNLEEVSLHIDESLVSENGPKTSQRRSLIRSTDNRLMKNGVKLEANGLENLEPETLYYKLFGAKEPKKTTSSSSILAQMLVSNKTHSDEPRGDPPSKDRRVNVLVTDSIKDDTDDGRHLETRANVNMLSIDKEDNKDNSTLSKFSKISVVNKSHSDKPLPDPLTKDRRANVLVTDSIKEEGHDERHLEMRTYDNDSSVDKEAKPTKKSSKRIKDKKMTKNKIKDKKKKKAKETSSPIESIESDGVSDTELSVHLEDDYQDQEDENPKRSRLKKMKVLEDEVVKNGSIPIVRVPIPRAELLPEKPQCVECGKMFSSRKTYRYHLNVLHKGNNKYPCPRCGKIYQWKSNLGRHMRTHKAVDAGELYCELCDKSFASVATYRQHLRISRRHVTENEFNYVCNECGKKFVNKTRLRDHIDWEHLKKIKFKCQQCNKPFKCHTSLYVHLQNVHGNKDKKDNLCHVCGKSYQNAAKLKYHITALHTGETPYRCTQCDAAFGWYSSLYRHVREVHYKVKTQSKKSKKSKKIDIEPPNYMNYHPM